MAPPTPLTLEERRARKAQRRIKQREITILRAAKMHRARLLAKAEGNQPASRDIKTSGLLPMGEKVAEGRMRGPSAQSPDVLPYNPPPLNIGCSGWFYWHLKGSFYPTQMPTRDWFAHYAEHFRTVELNAPFYSWPTLRGVEAWIAQAEGRDMIYTVKVSELITHIRTFEGTGELVRDFGYIADLLGPRMGCFLFQLPPSVHYSPERLANILGQLDPARRNVVEFRHASWWHDDVFAAFEAAGAIFCSCSGPRLPDAVVKTAADIYVRFHGIERWYRHDYSRDELVEWAARIRAANAQRVWIYFNNDFNGYAIKNATMLADILTT